MSKNYRMMSAMVLFRLEQELGAFIASRTPSLDIQVADIVDAIEAREQKKRPDLQIKNSIDLIAETYLEDLFQLSLRITKETPEHHILLALKQLCSVLSLYDIRNAVAHPNRPFPECYWYRIAAIATDPVLLQLQLQSVFAAFASAQQGKIEAPPEEWLSPPSWSVPNNLPLANDYDITGLIGRPKETKELLKLISTKRLGLIAIVAPGGVGKTALALDLLDKSCRTPEFHAFFDAIAFVSLKIEKLTATGIEILDAPSTIRELELKLAEVIPVLLGNEDGACSFQQVCDDYSDKNILLFIDNLETLLRDHPEDFDKFQLELPTAWRVLVTSRLTVNSATCLPIETLPENNAKHLARIYATRRNASALVDDDTIEKIVRPTRCNPLAIRLSVDSYILGHPLNTSIESASKDVVNFSYRNLLEVISQESVAVLECLFLLDPQTRIEIAESLTKSIDYVAKGIQELARTSLIWRDTSQQQESYSLYPAIRDLLLVSPRDQALRTEIQARLVKRREVMTGATQAQVSLSETHPDYVSPEFPGVVRDVLYETNKVLRGTKSLPEEFLRLIERLRLLKSEFSTLSVIPRAIARVHDKLGDKNTAISELKIAVAINKNDIPSLILLGRLQHAIGDYGVAFQTYKTLKDLGAWNLGGIDGRQCCNGYLINQLYIKDYKGLLDVTTSWGDNSQLKDLLGAFRARAWKRSIEQIKSPDERGVALNKSANILEEITKEYGHPLWMVGIFQEVISEICYSFSEITGFIQVKQATRLLSFVDNHISHVFKDRGGDLTKALDLVSKLRKIAITDNPFRSREWGTFIESSGGSDYIKADRKSVLSDSGSVIATTYHIPKPRSPFVFAKDESGKEYFAHFDECTSSLWSDWAALREGDQIALTADPTCSHEEGKAVRAVNIALL